MDRHSVMCNLSGWSCNGQPNDAFHNFYHMIRGGFVRLAMGWHRDVLLRKGLERMQMSSDLPAQMDLDLRTALLSDVWAWRHLHEKIIRWGWRSRGYVTQEEHAKWFGISLEKMLEEDKSADGLLQDAIELDELPTIEPLSESVWITQPMDSEHTIHLLVEQAENSWRCLNDALSTHVLEAFTMYDTLLTKQHDLVSKYQRAPRTREDFLPKCAKVLKQMLSGDFSIEFYVHRDSHERIQPRKYSELKRSEKPKYIKVTIQMKDPPTMTLEETLPMRLKYVRRKVSGSSASSSAPPVAEFQLPPIPHLEYYGSGEENDEPEHSDGDSAMDVDAEALDPDIENAHAIGEDWGDGFEHKDSDSDDADEHNKWCADQFDLFMGSMPDVSDIDRTPFDLSPSAAQTDFIANHMVGLACVEDPGSGASLDSPAGPAGDPANGPAEVLLLARTSSTWARVKRTPAGAALLIPEVRGCVIHKIHGTNPNGTDRKPRWQGRYVTRDGVEKTFTKTPTDWSEDALIRAYTEVVHQLWIWFNHDW